MTMMMTKTTGVGDMDAQPLIDALQVAVLLAQRVAVTSRQQAIDAAQCVSAIERAIAAVQDSRRRR